MFVYGPLEPYDYSFACAWANSTSILCKYVISPQLIGGNGEYINFWIYDVS